MKRKRRTRTSKGLTVAVVIAENLAFRSGRLEGDYSAFVGACREEALERAITARGKWTASGRYGPYRILVGTLTEEVKTPTNYKVVKLGKEKP